jgi:MerR family transcriptional regulator, light-induced transcriptional regulator
MIGEGAGWDNCRAVGGAGALSRRWSLHDRLCIPRHRSTLPHMATQGRLAPTHASRQPNYRRYWLSLYHRDLAAAQRVVDDALGRWSPQRIYLRLFEPALNLSGALWARQKITHQDEHFVTHHTLRMMRRVRHRFVPLETTGPLALVTGVGQESHLIGLRMVCDFLRWANWRIQWLPSNDRATVRQTIDRVHPDALLLSIGLDASLAPAARLIDDLRRRHSFRGLIAIGGRPINQNPALVQTLGADLTAANGAVLLRVLKPRFPKARRLRD